MRFSRPRAALLAALILMGCPEKSAVWIVDGSTATRLEFGIGRTRDDPRGFETDGIRVFRCDGPSAGEGAVWAASVDTVGPGPVKRVVYGDPLPGWRSVQGPSPITPGCYRAAISGTGRTEFEVKPDGSVVEKKVK